jgi:hypothetical protein
MAAERDVHVLFCMKERRWVERYREQAVDNGVGGG